MRICLIGHMTVSVELDGAVFLTDPWFGPHTWLERLLAPRGVPPAALPGALSTVQALLVSHHHLDHLDDLALALARLLGWRVIGPEAVTRRARRAGVGSVTSLHPGQATELGPLRISAMPAEHPLAADAIGFVIQGSRTLYFSGDTRFTPELAAALAPYRVDVALVQAACAHYPLIGSDGMSLAEAGALCRTIQPRWVLPLHLHCAGKWLDRPRRLRVKKDNAGEVRAAVREWFAALSADGVNGRLLEPGECWSVDSSEGISGRRTDR